jgi:DNA (cytosine-5)-methyltransferase 1
MPSLRVLDLFSGIGGFSIGLERAGMTTVAFCEIDKKAQLVLEKHWPDVPIFKDVSTLTKGLLDGRGITVDVICGGFPCQDISYAGAGAGIEGERSGLWSEYARLIGELRPQFVIVENVSALLSRGLDRVLGDLASIGYDAEWHCIPASAVGAPHRRDRVWIVAYPNNNGRNGPENAESNPARNGGGAPWKDISEQSSGSGDLGRDIRGGEEKIMADTVRAGLEGQREIASRIGAELNNTRNTGWWAVESDVGRVAHGIPKRMDRLKQLGNAVVPQIPELIGRAIINQIQNEI